MALGRLRGEALNSHNYVRWTCKMDPNNYRPMSVLPVIAKIFVKAIFKQTYDFLSENKLLSD